MRAFGNLQLYKSVIKINYIDFILIKPQPAPLQTFNKINTKLSVRNIPRNMSDWIDLQNLCKLKSD